MNPQNHSNNPGFRIFTIFLLVFVLLVSSQGAYIPAAGQATLDQENLVQTSGENPTSNIIQNTHRSIRFPSNALNFDKASTILTQYSTGIRWQSNYLNPAYLTIPRPSDWDGVSDVNMNLYFLPSTSTGGNVQFFIRPRAFDPGDSFVDASSLAGDAVPVSLANQVLKQTITIPASRFGNKELWVITIQRQGSLETYAGDVTLTSVNLSYGRINNFIYSPIIIR